MSDTLFPTASLDGLRRETRAQAVFLPALAPFAPQHWPLVGLLPVLDINGALAAALASRAPFRTSPPIAGIFAADPFLRLADLAETLRRAAVTQVINYPTVQLYDGETTAALASVGYRAEAEFRLLLRLAERGFAPIACVTSRDAADLALALGLRRMVLHPGLGARARPAAWWAELAGHVAIEGGEPLRWREPAVGQVSRPSRRIRL